MENSKRKRNISRIALDYDLNQKIKAMAIKLSKPKARVTIEDIVTSAIKKWLAENK